MLRIEPKPMFSSGPTSFSQINSPVFPSSAWITLPVFQRYMMPLCTSGIVWLAPLSFMFQTHARRRSFTLAAVISLSGL